MATPPTQVVASVTSWSGTGTTLTSASITVAVGDVIVVRGMSPDTTCALVTPTNSGTAQTWTLQRSVVVSGYSTAYLWTAVSTAAQAMTITVTAPGNTLNSLPWGFRYSQYTASDGVGVSGAANTSGAPSLALTTQAANSAVECSSSDWTAVDGTTRTWRTVNGAPMTEQGYFRDAAQYTNYSGWRSDCGAAGAITVGLSAPTGQKYSIVGVEILGRAGGATAYPFGLTTPTPRYAN